MKTSLFKSLSVMFFPLLSANAFMGSEHLTIQAFDYHVRTQDLELSEVSTIVRCETHDSAYYEPRISQIKKVSRISVVAEAQNDGKINRVYRISSPAITDKGSFPTESGMCSLQIEFAGPTQTERAVYSLELEGYKYIHLCANETHTSNRSLTRSIPGLSKASLSRNCPAYKNYYANAQQMLSKILLRKATLNDQSIIIVPSKNYESSFEPIALKAKEKFETYWRKVRRGDDVEVYSASIQDDRRRILKNLGALAGLAIYPGNPIVGMAAGAIVGDSMGSGPQAEAKYFKRRKLPHVQDEMNEVVESLARSSLELIEPRYSDLLIDLKLSNSNFLSPAYEYTKVQKLVSASEIQSYQGLIQLYVSLLSVREPLSQDETIRLQKLKAAYSPKADRIFDLILSTDYENQGACVKNENCDKQ